MLAPQIVKLRVLDLVNEADSFAMIAAVLAIVADEAAESFGIDTRAGQRHARNANRLRSCAATLEE